MKLFFVFLVFLFGISTLPSSAEGRHVVYSGSSNGYVFSVDLTEKDVQPKIEQFRNELGVRVVSGKITIKFRDRVISTMVEDYGGVLPTYIPKDEKIVATPMGDYPYPVFSFSLGSCGMHECGTGLKSYVREATKGGKWGSLPDAQIVSNEQLLTIFEKSRPFKYKTSFVVDSVSRLDAHSYVVYAKFCSEKIVFQYGVSDYALSSNYGSTTHVLKKGDYVTMGWDETFSGLIGYFDFKSHATECSEPN